MFTIRLLVADSSKGLQTYVRQLFENFGFDPELIKTADSPQAALSIAEELKPDFLLTDWFPKAPLSGIDLYQKILAHNPECQFALLSSETGPAQCEEAKKAGAIFLQAKPCSAADLRTALGKALQQISTENPKLNSHVGAMTSAAARHLSALTVAAKIPTFAPGDKVMYRGNVDTIKHVILRRGETVVQLRGVAGLVPATEVLKV